ncbi:hypothetical protein [Variovorax sp. E3]|uniref:hypothetical protein n=1 Tax=Variovorax sp. E3 TaxID=1914993 RepID=UPI0022B6B6E6|nr:hypothetical protein [Variovorax sp. E3]
MNSSTFTSSALSRRLLLRAGVGAAATAAALPLFAQAPAKTLRIGYQKFNTLNILKGTGQLEKALARPA